MQQTGDGPPGDDDYYDSVEEESIRVLAAAATPTQLPGTRRRNRGLGGRSSSTVQQLLVVPGQLLPPGERPADMEELLSPLAVIPPKVRSYAQAATSSPLDGADWVYVAKGGGQRPMADKYSGPYKVLEQANKAWKVQVGEKVEIISRDHLKPHLGRILWQPGRPHLGGRGRPLYLLWPLLLQRRGQGALCSR